MVAENHQGTRLKPHITSGAKRHQFWGCRPNRPSVRIGVGKAWGEQRGCVMRGARGKSCLAVQKYRHGLRVVFASVLVTVLSLGALSVSPASASSDSAVAHPNAGPPNNSAYNWVELHRDSHLGGYANNSSLSTSNVGSLGVRWAKSMYGSALASPVVSDHHPGNDGVYRDRQRICPRFQRRIRSTRLEPAIGWGRHRITGGERRSPMDGNSEPPKLYKFNLTTGAIECSLVTPKQFFSSFTAATPPVESRRSTCRTWMTASPRVPS